MLLYVVQVTVGLPGLSQTWHEPTRLLSLLLAGGFILLACGQRACRPWVPPWREPVRVARSCNRTHPIQATMTDCSEQEVLGCGHQVGDGGDALCRGFQDLALAVQYLIGPGRPYG